MKAFRSIQKLIIEDTHPKDVIGRLYAFGCDRGHFNNGTFTLPVDDFAPGFLAGFQCTLDLVSADPLDPLIVAINSDYSMLQSYKGKSNERELTALLIPQRKRADAVIETLSAMYPDRKVAAVYYDTPTPEELYATIAAIMPSLGESLHKIGFGTNPKDKPIVGGKYFKHLRAYPFHFDERPVADNHKRIKPVMHDDTRETLPTDRPPDSVERLTERIGPHGKPYITKESGLLFPVPPALKKYMAKSFTGPNGTLPIPKNP